MNLDKGGKGVITKEKRSKSSIERSIEAHEKPVLALTKDNKIFMRFESASKAAKYFNLASTTAVSNALNGWSKSCQGYLWVFEEDYDANKVYSYHPDYENFRKAVYEFDFSGNLIKIWAKTSDFVNGYSEHGVRNAIKAKKAYHDSYWSYNDTIDVSEYKNPYKFRIQVNDSFQYFKSQRQMASFLNIPESSLSQKLKNGITNINNYNIERI
jgi:hypothetical protein